MLLCHNEWMLRPILILLAVSLTLTGLSACGKEDPNKLPAKKSSEIIKDYIDTVVTAPEKARDAGKMVEEQQQRTEEMLKQLEE